MAIPKKVVKSLEKNSSYQLEYAAGRKQMYDKASRKRKGERMVKLFSLFYSKAQMEKMSVLDIGGSTGIIDEVLAKYFKNVIGSDIDAGAIKFANKKFKKKNLKFVFDDIMKSGFRNNQFDIIICTHVYEHVPNQKKLFDEIRRILKPGGLCYLAATNRFQLIEPHYNLPFLSVIPRSIAHRYIRLLNKAEKYHENPKSYWFLKRLTKKFEVLEFTDKIVKQPYKYGYSDSIAALMPVRLLGYPLTPIVKYFSPTFIWILKKKDN